MKQKTTSRIRRDSRKEPRQVLEGVFKRRTWSDPARPYLVPLLLAALARAFYSHFAPYAGEDAYITFRYAENWARGFGPTYNPGELVMGYSSPLWTAWLALGAFLSDNTLIWARVSNLLMDAVILVLGARVLEREHSRTSAWLFAVFFATWSVFAVHALLAYETSLLLLLVIASSWAVAGHHRVSGILLGLLALTRPEAVLAAAVIALGASWRSRAVGFGIFALGCLALALYYGTVIPQSLTAKAAVYGTPGPAGGIHWVEALVPAFFKTWPQTAEGQHIFPLAVLGFPAMIAASAILWRRAGASRLVTAAGFAILAGYVIVGVPYFSWYVCLPLAVWGWTVAIGLPAVVRHRAVWVGLAIYILSDVFFLRLLYGGRAAAEAEFRHVGLLLRQVSEGRGSVFLEPIGHIGYMSGLRVIDEVGLVSPEVQRLRTRGAGWYTEILNRERPDYLVFRAETLTNNEAWAGKGTPFRSTEEMQLALAAYERVTASSASMPERLLILRRRTPGR